MIAVREIKIDRIADIREEIKYSCDEYQTAKTQGVYPLLAPYPV